MRGTAAAMRDANSDGMCTAEAVKRSTFVKARAVSRLEEWPLDQSPPCWAARRV